MRALVTGATGFIGSRLVTRLVAEGWQVKALVRETSDIAGLQRQGIKLVFGDISNSFSVQKSVRGMDIVFNSAAVLPYHGLEERVYWSVNVEGVKNVMEACRHGRVKRVIHLSTVGIYGSTSKKGVSEKSKPRVFDVYSRTKLEGEKIVWRHIRSGLPAVIIRPTIGYGPGDTRPGFIDLFKLIKMGVFIPIGKGENFFHTVYVDNLIDALLLAACKKEAIGEDFIIGDEPCPRMKDIISAIVKATKSSPLPITLPTFAALLTAKLFNPLKHMGFPVPLTTQRVKFITEDRIFSIKKAKHLLGYKAKVKLQEGFTRTYGWYKREGYLHQ